MTPQTFVPFATWADLLDAIAGDYTIYYQAPLDYRPSVVGCVVRKDGKVRVTPVYGDADPFTADVAHLTRFRRHDRNTDTLSRS